MISKANVPKIRSHRAWKRPPERSPGAVSTGSGDTGSGDRIRTCDLWVMSPATRWRLIYWAARCITDAREACMPCDVAHETRWRSIALYGGPANYPGIEPRARCSTGPQPGAIAQRGSVVGWSES